MSSDEKLSCEKMKSILLHVADVMIESENYLTDLDRACGDGDFGVGMLRGFTKVKEQIQSYQGDELEELFTRAGLAIMAVVGGASGAVFGSFFSSIGAKLRGKKEAGLADLAEAFKASLEMIMRIGGARPGDKTMVDALAPAVDVLLEGARSGESLKTTFRRAAEAAEKGAEATKGMIAQKGKASYLGEQSLGYPDPGAVGVALIFKAIAESIQ
ncbi:MAG: dihydroxyacetone kinase subunit DhaL [Nitrososphaerota archaeon]